MSNVYVVAVIVPSGLEILDVYSGIQQALGRAWNIAVARGDQWEANPSPSEEKNLDGSSKWCILRNSKHWIGVFSKTVQMALLPKKEYEALDAQNVSPQLPGVPGFGDRGTKSTLDGYQLFKSVPHLILDGYVSFLPPPPSDEAPLNMQMIPPVDMYNATKWDLKLPVGWNKDDKPILLQDLCDDPCNVKPYSLLTDQQCWAIVKARVSKQPNYSAEISNGVYLQAAALQSLGKSYQDRNDFGWELVEKEIKWLAGILENEIYQETQGY